MSRSASFDRMRPDQGRHGGIQIALDQRDVHGLVDVIFVARQLETAMLGLHAILLVLRSHRTLVLQASSESDPRWCRSSGSLRLHANSSRSGRRVPWCPSSFRNLDDHGGGRESGQARQIAACLGMSGACQHAARLRHQRKNMTRLTQVLRPRVGRHRGLDRVRAIVRGYSRWSPPRRPRSTE